MAQADKAMFNAIQSQMELFMNKMKQLDVIQAKMESLESDLKLTSSEIQSRLQTLEENILAELKTKAKAPRTAPSSVSSSSSDQANTTKTNYPAGNAFVNSLLPQCLESDEYKAGYGKKFWDWFSGLSKGEVSFLDYVKDKFDEDLSKLEENSKDYFKLLSKKCWDEINTDKVMKNTLNQLRIDYNNELSKDMNADKPVDPLLETVDVPAEEKAEPASKKTTKKAAKVEGDAITPVVAPPRPKISTKAPRT